MTYKQKECYKCGVALVVPDYDDSAYTYCQACAFSKIGAVRIPNGVGHDR